MKPIKIYILHLFILTLLTLVLNMGVGWLYRVSFWDIFFEIRIYFFTDAVACLSLCMFYIKSTLKSSFLIIIVCTICFLLVSLFGYIGQRTMVWYSNIPEEVIIHMTIGLPLCFAKLVAAFITSSFTAITNILLIKIKNH
jgi:hypothetical protein